MPEQTPLPYVKEWGKGEDEDGADYRLSALDYREWFQSGDALCDARGLHHFDYFSNILVGFRHFLGDATPAMRSDGYTQSFQFTREVAAVHDMLFEFGDVVADVVDQGEAEFSWCNRERLEKSLLRQMHHQLPIAPSKIRRCRHRTQIRLPFRRVN